MNSAARNHGALRDRPALALLILAVGLYAALCWQAVSRLGPGYDEVAHVAGAYQLVAQRDNRLNPEHPPLVKVLSGLIVRLGSTAFDSEISDYSPNANIAQWRIGAQLLSPAGQFDGSTLLLARLAPVAIGLLGLVVVWHMATVVAGWRAGGVASLMYASSPTILAAASMLLTDLPLGVFALAAFWCGWMGSQQHRAAFLVLSGVAAAAACASKYSGIAVPVLVLLALTCSALVRQLPRKQFAGHIGCFLIGFLAGLPALIWPIGIVDYLHGFTSLGANHRADYAYYAFGHASTNGFAWYFLGTLLLKSTVAELLVLLGLAVSPIIALVSRRQAPTPDSESGLQLLAWMAAFPLVLLVAMSLYAPNAGHRYMTPIYPFLCVGAGVLMARSLLKSTSLLVGVLLMLQVTSGIHASPNPLRFFNGIAGCYGIQANRCLDDSNIDWGQLLPRLHYELGARGLPTRDIAMDVFAGMSAEHFGFGYRPVTDADWMSPEPRLYVVSAHRLVRRAIAIPNLHEGGLYQALVRADTVLDTYYIVDLRNTPSAPDGMDRSPSETGRF